MVKIVNNYAASKSKTGGFSPYHDDSHYLVLLRSIYGWNNKSRLRFNIELPDRRITASAVKPTLFLIKSVDVKNLFIVLLS